MSLLNQAIGRRAVNANNPTYPLTSNTLLELFNVANTNSGKSISVQTSFSMTAVYRAISLVAGTTAGVPLKTFKVGDTNRVETTQDHPVILNPHPGMTAFEHRELMVTHLASWGNYFAEKRRDGEDRVVELWAFNPERVKVGRVTPSEDMPDGKIYEIMGDMGGETVVLTSRDVFHIPGFGYDGLVGISPIMMAKEAIAAGLAAEEFGNKLWASGALVGGLITSKQRLDRPKAEELKRRWNERIGGGLARAHEIAVLDSGAEFTQLTLPPGDAQFIQQRKFQVTEIARIFGIPPHLLADVNVSTSWGSGLTEQTLGFVIFSLKPAYLDRLEARFTKEVMPETDFAEFILDGLLRGDPEKRADIYTQALNGATGWMSRNEVRALENLPADDVVPTAETFQE